MKNPINIGAMRHEVAIFEEVDTRKPGGGKSTVRTKRLDTMAAVNPNARRSVTIEGGLQVVAEYELIVRQDEAIKNLGIDWEIDYKAAKLRVLEAYDPTQRGEWLVILCEENKR